MRPSSSGHSLDGCRSSSSALWESASASLMELCKTYRIMRLLSGLARLLTEICCDGLGYWDRITVFPCLDLLHWSYGDSEIILAFSFRLESFLQTRTWWLDCLLRRICWFCSMFCQGWAYWRWDWQRWSYWSSGSCNSSMPQRWYYRAQFASYCWLYARRGYRISVEMVLPSC